MIQLKKIFSEDEHVDGGGRNLDQQRKQTAFHKMTY